MQTIVYSISLMNFVSLSPVAVLAKMALWQWDEKQWLTRTRGVRKP
jgi:hypothetical protein